jgi:parvulin-like peptidyl-prolyl isomerase
MSKTLQIRNQTIPSEKLFTLLANYQMLPQFLRQVITDQAIANLTCTPQEQTQARQQFYQKYQLTTAADRQALQDLYDLTLDELEDLALREQKITRFKQTTWAAKLPSYFLTRKTGLDRVIYSIIQVPDLELAQELYFRLQDQEQSFSQLARCYSQGPEAQTGGLVGPLEFATLPAPLSELLHHSYPQQLWPPTRIGDWITIGQLEQRLPAQLDHTMHQRLLNEQFEQWLQAELVALLEGSLISLEGR